MAVRKKRGRKHPGVTLCKPSEAKRMGWRLRWKDPDTGRMQYERLPADCTTSEQRELLAVAKSKAIARRRMELEVGAPRATGARLATVLQRYFDAHATLRPRTLEIYRNAADKLESWASKAGVKPDNMTRAKLMTFREALVREPKRIAAKGAGMRGKRIPGTKRRTPASINQELRAVRTVLGYVRDLDLLPKLSHDDLRRALKRLPVTAERIEFLSPAQCRQLLEAAIRHDAETFTETRDEHKGLRELGTTKRYSAIAPFTFFLLATGMRLGEALSLGWRSVDLDAIDDMGRAVGEIHLGGADTKTGRARTVGLEVSPALRSMLVKMKLASGGKGKVFALTAGEADAALARLRSTYGAPSEFSWQTLRRTCGTFLTNAPGIFGAASAYRSAAQLGHSVQVAQKAYLGLVRGIPRDAHDIETAMQIGEQVEKIVAHAHERTASNVVQLTAEPKKKHGA